MTANSFDEDQRRWVVDFQTRLDQVDLRHDHAQSPIEKRRRVCDQLRVIAIHLDQHPNLRNSAFYDDLFELVLDLEALDRGRQPETLKAVTDKKGMATTREDEFKNYVLLAHRFAVLAGCKVTEADGEVAKMLARADFGGTKKADREISTRVGFPTSTIANWRANPFHPNTLEAKVLEKRYARLSPILSDMAAAGRSKSDMLQWIERTVIEAPILRRLRT